MSYDRSDLPHYASGIDEIASAMSIPPGDAVADANTTDAEIIANDAPDTVVAWYRMQLPQEQWQMQAHCRQRKSTRALNRPIRSPRISTSSP